MARDPSIFRPIDEAISQMKSRTGRWQKYSTAISRTMNIDIGQRKLGNLLEATEIQNVFETLERISLCGGSSIEGRTKLYGLRAVVFLISHRLHAPRPCPQQASLPEC